MTSAASRQKLLTSANPMLTGTGTSLSPAAGGGPLADTAVLLRRGDFLGQAGELGLEAPGGVRSGQPAKVNHGGPAVSAGGAHEHPAPANHERHQQPGERGERGQQRR